MWLSPVLETALMGMERVWSRSLNRNVVDMADFEIVQPYERRCETEHDTFFFVE